jgi:small subunit ribosomal protein S17
MGRPRKKAEELVPDEAPLEELADAERAVEDAEPAARRRPAKRAKPTKKRTAAPRGERKAIVRLPKPEHARGRRKERRGVVVSNAMEKTVVVRVETVKPDRRYKKVVRRSSKLHAHDERNEANVGDVVRIVETRPLSKTKSWRVAEVIQAAQ